MVRLLEMSLVLVKSMRPALKLEPLRQDFQAAAAVRLPQRHCTCANVD